MIKKILIRADASDEIGIGHVTRCIALANAAQEKGWECIFVIRNPTDELSEHITSLNHRIEKLISVGIKNVSDGTTAYGRWLSVSQTQDANETLRAIHHLMPDWIIVDHYALNAKWLSIVKRSNAKVLVIDDLGNRDLICDLLLDQNYGACPEKYSGKLSRDCRLLLGPTFSLLRHEFKEWREHSLERRSKKYPENILITMGGGDIENYTLKVLKEIKKSKHSNNCSFTVIIGKSYPHTTVLKEFLRKETLKVSLLSDIKNMAEIMSESDLCIGAAGSTSWERCCLGLPSIVLPIADNQVEIANQLGKANLAIHSKISYLLRDFERFFAVSGPELLRTLSANSRIICDGLGAFRVLENLESSL